MNELYRPTPDRWLGDSRAIRGENEPLSDYVDRMNSEIYGDNPFVQAMLRLYARTKEVETAGDSVFGGRHES